MVELWHFSLPVGLPVRGRLGRRVGSVIPVREELPVLVFLL